MLGKYKFRIGQRVRPSQEGIEANIFTKTRIHGTGIVVKVDKFNCPTILWDWRTTTSGYHPRFIKPDYRRASIQQD